MIRIDPSESAFEEVDRPGFSLTTMSLLISDSQSAEFNLKHFRLDPDAVTELHSHKHEQLHYILRGKGILTDGKEERTVHAGEIWLINSRDPHAFTNPHKVPFDFLTVVSRTAS